MCAGAKNLITTPRWPRRVCVWIRPERPTTARPVEKAYFGADVAQEDDRLMVRRVYAGSPAYEQGLNAGDQIVALEQHASDQRVFRRAHG